MNQRTTNLILIGMLAGVIIGALLGVVWPQAMLATSVIGQLFINALKLVILPLIVASLIVGVTSLGDVRKVGRTGVKVIVYFLATTTIAVVIGLILVNIIRPGDGVSTAAAQLTEGVRGAQARSVTDILLNLIPANIVKAMVDGQYLGIIIFSLFIGGVLTTLGPRA
ncbi:MAG: dicarboxylate/amino acid:cation symporter, partial [Candidatus Zixiibacteriota bacterium]